MFCSYLTYSKSTFTLGRIISFAGSLPECDGIERDQKLDYFSVYMSCPTHYSWFVLSVFHSSLVGNLPKADDGVPC